MKRNRLISLIALFLIQISILAPLVYWSSQPGIIDETIDEQFINFTATRRMILPGTCVSLQWTADSLYELTLNGERIPNVGDQVVCPSTSTGYQLQIEDQNGLSFKKTLYVRVFLSTSNSQLFFLIFVIFSAMLAVLIAVIGDLPWLSDIPPIVTVSNKLSQIRLAGTLLLSSKESRVDLFFVTLLILMAGTPLVLIRYSTLVREPEVVFGMIVLWMVTLVVWLITSRSRQSAYSWSEFQNRLRSSSRVSLKYLTWPILILLVVTIVGYYVPMQSQFWLGGDEIRVLKDGIEGWDSIGRYDTEYGRPLTPLGSIIAVNITPESVKGYLWLAFLLRFMTAIATYGITLQLFSNRTLALAASLLFIVNPAESSRYLSVHMQAYNLAVFLMMISLYAYLRSSKDGNRALLVLSCVGLGISLLIVETGFVVSLIWPVLLWLTEKRLNHRGVWAYSWFATTSLFAIRFLQFNAVSSTSYQSTLLGDRIDFVAIVGNFLHQIALGAKYLEIPHAPVAYWGSGILLFCIVGGGLLKQSSVAPNSLMRKRYFVGLFVLLAANVLSFLPYLSINGVLGTIRTQFFSAPFQAMGWAIIVGLVGTFMSSLRSHVWNSLAVSVLVMLAAVGGLNHQNDRLINPRVTYDTTTRLVQQVLQLAPAVKPGTALIFLNAPEVDDTLLGWNYYVVDLSNYILGVGGFQVEYTDSLGITHALDRTGTTGKYGYGVYTIEQLIVFEIDQTGNVQLLHGLPDRLIASQAYWEAFDYEPLARIAAPANRSGSSRFFTTLSVD